MGGAVLSFTAMAVAVRELQRHIGSFEIVFLRSVVMLAIVLAMVPHAGTAALRTRRFAMHFWRNSIHFCGQVLWVYSIGALTLATVFAIEFTMPVDGAPRLDLPQGEVHLPAPGDARARPRRRADHRAARRRGVPSGGVAMILGSLCYASSFIFTKRLSSTDSALAVLFWMAVVQTPISLAPRRRSGWRRWRPTCLDPCHRDRQLQRALLHDAGDEAGGRDGRGADRLHPAAADRGGGRAVYGEPFDPLVLAGAAIIFAGTYYSLSRERR